jgi:hypothetical protein
LEAEAKLKAAQKEIADLKARLLELEPMQPEGQQPPPDDCPKA